MIGEGRVEFQSAADGEMTPVFTQLWRQGGLLLFVGENGGITRFAGTLVAGVVVGGAFVFCNGLLEIAVVIQRLGQQEVHVGGLRIVGEIVDIGTVEKSCLGVIARFAATPGGGVVVLCQFGQVEA